MVFTAPDQASVSTRILEIIRSFHFLRGMMMNWMWDQILNWCSSNFIALNLSKTNFKIYCRKSNVCPRITQVTSSKYLLSTFRVDMMKNLGLVIDQILSFKTHIQNSFRLSPYPGVGILKRILLIKLLRSYYLNWKFEFYLVESYP